MEEREIKFRAWDKDVKKFRRIVGIEYADGVPIRCHFSESAWDDGFIKSIKANDGVTVIILQQYTGLKDKNGKEIYEGDIVKCHDHPTGASDTIGKVYWKDGKWMVTWSMVDLGDYGTAWIEIIGNIHQNPELLNQ